jgi:hypothetical protein
MKRERAWIVDNRTKARDETSQERNNSRSVGDHVPHTVEGHEA